MGHLLNLLSWIAKHRGKSEIGKLVQENLRLKRHLEIQDVAARITGAIKSCNMLLFNLVGVPARIFREDIEAISVLHQPCYDANDFRVKIGGLAELFQIEPKEWKSALKKFDGKVRRGTTLIRKWLDQQKIAYNHEKTKVWDEIINLRNFSFPYHPPNKKRLETIQFFHGSFPMQYEELYESILGMFLESLEMLQTVMSNYSAQRNLQEDL